jgi:hypothetical protein
MRRTVRTFCLCTPHRANAAKDLGGSTNPDGRRLLIFGSAQVAVNEKARRHGFSTAGPIAIASSPSAGAVAAPQQLRRCHFSLARAAGWVILAASEKK